MKFYQKTCLKRSIGKFLTALPSVSLLYSFMVTLLFLCGCANQEPPDGGPVDTTTPVIESVYPDSNKLFFNDTRIRFGFDRYVDERSFEESMFISPYIGSLEFEWNGTEVEVTFSEKLKKNTTYVINIGTDVKDKSRNGLRMAKAYSLAFSTGPDIDRGGLEGRVYPRKAGEAVTGIMIFAYLLNNVNPDTLNPMKAQPDFITQTGQNGDFFLHHIPFGTYRIFAVRDEYRNLVYDQETDEYGVPSGIISLSSDDTLSSGLVMKLTKEDTTAPRLIKAAAANRNHVIAEFSETLNPQSVHLSSFVIVDTMKGKPLELVTVYPSPVSQTSYILVTQKQDSTQAYLLNVQGITDSVGNKINPLAHSFVFRGSPAADSLPPKLVSLSLKDSTQNLELRPLFTMTFSDALAKTASLDFVNILDNNKQQVPTLKQQVSDCMITLTPHRELQSLQWYTVRAELRTVQDWKGRPCSDSTKSWHFETLDAEDLSSVEGAVTDMNRTDTAGNLYVTAMQIGEKVPKSYTTPADAAGKFLFPQIAEGRFVLQVFRDRNKNGVYDGGTPFPFRYSERLSPVSDTLKVRARWPLDGVKILFR